MGGIVVVEVLVVDVVEVLVVLLVVLVVAVLLVLVAPGVDVEVGAGVEGTMVAVVGDGEVSTPAASSLLHEASAKKAVTLIRIGARTSRKLSVLLRARPAPAPAFGGLGDVDADNFADGVGDRARNKDDRYLPQHRFRD